MPFTRYTRHDPAIACSAKSRNGKNELSHFAVEANLLDRPPPLEGAMFCRVRVLGGGGSTGKKKKNGHLSSLHPRRGQARKSKRATSGRHLHRVAAAARGTDLLFYEGLHGGRGEPKSSIIARHVDLLVGVAPTMNLEWIQKIDS